MIDKITDTELIKSLWRPYTNELGICSSEYINTHDFFAYYIDNDIAGIVDYEIKNKIRVVEIGILLVMPNFRGKGVSTKLIKHVYKQVNSLIETLGYKFIVRAYEGLPNNKMYEHISTSWEVINKDAKRIMIRYYLDTERFRGDD